VGRTRIFTGDRSYENVTYFTGGTVTTDDDPHNRYAADAEGFGRDYHFIDGIGGTRQPMGLEGAFREARAYATKESKEIFQWVKLNIPCSAYSKIFTDYWMLPSSGSRGVQV
jgi:hypothetical protein